MDLGDTVTIDLERQAPEREFIILWQAGMKYEGLHECIEEDPELWIDAQDLPTTSIIRSRVLTLNHLLLMNPYVEGAME